MSDIIEQGQDEGGIIEIDVSNELNPFDPAPHGNYRLEIKEYSIGASQASGNPMISAQYQIVRAYDAANEEHVGKVVFDNMVIQGKGDKFGKWRHRQVTEAVGLPLTGGPASAYVGKQFDAELKVTPGNEEYPAKNSINNIFVGGVETGAPQIG